MSTTVRIEGLTVAFSGTPVVRDVDMEVPAGGITVLLGRSGSGKTTLLRAVNRLNECFPGCTTSGRVRLALKDGQLDAYAPDRDVEELRRRVGMVFQTPNVLPMSVEKNLLLPLRLVCGIAGLEAHERMRSALNEAGLWDEVENRLNAGAQTLSGGQQQRLCLARAIALEPDVLLLDEPTASVDYQSALRLEELLLRLKERYTLLVVSHSLRQAQRIAERIVVMRAGQISRVLEKGELAKAGSLEEVLDDCF
ncbi:phosphate ABC transporter ATP-binding protein [Desulfocurvibacter africanus]|uniref:phosphate ABC transporter ATP-binding protein n=1 Tax=Desulfocurvibacter africanus TaxID=873 RepID=UPI002FDACF93